MAEDAIPSNFIKNTSLLSFPNCKINLGLHVINKRTDGYHNLETIFFPIGKQDALEIITADHLSFKTSGLAIGGKAEDNLCVKAYQLLKEHFPKLPAVSIHLHKTIPMGAGLGGGSADGAFMLTLLNNKYKLELTEQQLITFALLLGSDCPFFIQNKPCFAEGRGEMLTPININLEAYSICIVNPGIHISTKEAFEKLVPKQPQKKIREIIQQPVNTWKDELVNDFEQPVFELFPSISEIKSKLYAAGAVYASMTGSGSTVFALFEKHMSPKLEFPETYGVFHI